MAFTPVFAASFLNSVEEFFGQFAEVGWLWLLLGCAFFGAYLTTRSRAYFNVLRAAYPNERIQFRYIWGAYIAAYGFNNVVPARGGDLIRLFLTKTEVPNSSYPAVASSFLVEAVFDVTMASPDPAVRLHAGRLPQAAGLLQARRLRPLVLRRPPALHAVPGHRVLAVAVIARFALLSARVRAFWARVRQGVTILRDRRRYLREVWLVQFGAWLVRFSAFWCMLEAFDVGGSVRNVLLVLGVNAVAAVVPFTPGGAGVQQALLVKVFAGTATGATVAAYSVGQQIAIASFTFGARVPAARAAVRDPQLQGGHPPRPRGARGERAARVAAGERSRLTAGPGGPRARA